MRSAQPHWSAPSESRSETRPVTASHPTSRAAPSAIRAAASVRGSSTGHEALDEDHLDRPEQRRGQDHRLAAAERDRSRAAGEPCLPADERARSRATCAGPESLSEERYREQRDPDDERLVDERRLRCRRAREPLEEEDERDAAADAASATSPSRCRLDAGRTDRGSGLQGRAAPARAGARRRRRRSSPSCRRSRRRSARRRARSRTPRRR